jgi:hypothetical protein
MHPRERIICVHYRPFDQDKVAVVDILYEYLVFPFRFRKLSSPVPHFLFQALGLITEKLFVKILKIRAEAGYGGDHDLVESKQSLCQEGRFDMRGQQRDHRRSILLESPLHLRKSKPAVKPLMRNKIDELTEIGPLVVH